MTAKVQDDGLSFESRLRVVGEGGTITPSDDGISEFVATSLRYDHLAFAEMGYLLRGKVARAPCRDHVSRIGGIASRL